MQLMRAISSLRCLIGTYRSRFFPTTCPKWSRRRRVIAAWGKNVYVKLPVTNTRSEPLFEAVRALSRDGVKINMTAIFTGEQVARAVEALDGGAPACVSVFAGRLADFGIDYRPIMQDAIARARKTRNVEIIWASTREVFNVVEADAMGCHIITAPADVLKKLPALGTKTAAELSLGSGEIVPRRRGCGGLAACGSGFASRRIIGLMPRLVILSRL